MAKLKLWVRNLIIILATAICLAGVAVGIYFICRPTDDDQTDNLTPEQKAYVDAMNKTEQPDIDISHYDGLVLEDGTSVEAGDIIHSFGNYVVVENKITGLPEFFAITKNETQSSAPNSANSQTSSLLASDASSANNVILKKVNIQSDYSHIYMLNDEYATYGDYAIVTDNSAQPTIWVVNLKTGETVLENNQINKSGKSDEQLVVPGDSSSDKTNSGLLPSGGTDSGLTLSDKTNSGLLPSDGADSGLTLPSDKSNSGLLPSTGDGGSSMSSEDSYSLSIEKMFGNFLIVKKKASVSYTIGDSTTILYPLDNVDAKIEFVNGTETLLDCELIGDYIYVLTTKNTYVYSAQLSQTGAWQNILTLANSFVMSSQEDSHVEIENLGYFKDVVYYRIQVLDNTKLFIEKRETKSDWQANEYGKVEGYSAVAYISDYFSNHKVGFNYLIYDVANQTYVENLPKFYGKVDVLESFVDGYYVLNTHYVFNYKQQEISSAVIYDSSLNFVLEYNADIYGTIFAFDGEHFVTTGTNASIILSPDGNSKAHYAGYNIISSSIVNNYTVVTDGIFYSLYDTINADLYSDKYYFMSQIMNGKVLAYRENDGYYLINLSDNEIDVSPIYNFDTTTINGGYGINLYFASVGFYFTYTNGIYTYVGLDGTTYKNVQTYSYKILGDNVYLSLTFVNGSHKLIVSKMLGTMPNLSDETIENTYLNNLSQPETQLEYIATSSTNTSSRAGGSGVIKSTDTGVGSSISQDMAIPVYTVNAELSTADKTYEGRTYAQNGITGDSGKMSEYGIYDGIFYYNYPTNYDANKYGTNVKGVFETKSQLVHDGLLGVAKKYGITSIPVQTRLDGQTEYPASYASSDGGFYLRSARILASPYFVIILTIYTLCYDNPGYNYCDLPLVFVACRSDRAIVPVSGSISVKTRDNNTDLYLVKSYNDEERNTTFGNTFGIVFNNSPYYSTDYNFPKTSKFSQDLGSVSTIGYVWQEYAINNNEAFYLSSSVGIGMTISISNLMFQGVRLDDLLSDGGTVAFRDVLDASETETLGQVVTVQYSTQYGFVQNSDESDYTAANFDSNNVYNASCIGAPRKDLSCFLKNVSFGYDLEGMKFKWKESDRVWNYSDDMAVNTAGKYTTANILGYSSVFALLKKKASNCPLVVSEKPKEFTLQYYYLDENDDTKVITNGINFKIKFGQTLTSDNFVEVLGNEKSITNSKTQVKAPAGYEFLCWVVGYGKKSVKSGYFTYVTSPAEGAGNMKLKGGESVSSSYKQVTLDQTDSKGNKISTPLKYLPADGKTLGLTAIYVPKEYTFTLTYGYFNSGYTICSKTVYYDTGITIYAPYSHMSGNVTNDIVLRHTSEDFINISNRGSVKFTIHKGNIEDYLEGGYGSWYNMSSSIPFDDCLRPVDYDTTISGNVDSHVYDSLIAEKEFLHESQIKIPSFTVTGNKYERPTTLTQTKNAEATYTFGSGAPGQYNFISGQTYTITIPGLDEESNGHKISRNFKVKVELEDGTGTKNYYWNYAGETNYSKAIMSDGILTITTDPIGGPKGSTVTLTVSIETAFYDGTLTSTSTDDQDSEETAEIIDIGHISVSDKVADSYHIEIEGEDSNKNRHYYFGGGTTLLLTTGLSDANAQIYDTLYTVNNSYLSGLEVTHNGKTYKYSAKTSYDNNDVLHDDLISSTTWKISQNPVGYRYSQLRGSSGWSDLEYNGELIIHMDYVQQFYGLLYGKYRENINDAFSVSGKVYYYVLPITLTNPENSDDTEDAYLIILSNVNDSGNSDGVRACFLYNVANQTSNGESSLGIIKQETYQFNVLHTKINSTLTFDSTLNGVQQTSDDKKRYLSLNDTSGQAVVKTDGDKQYLTIFDRKVYVTIDDGKLKVNKELTADDDYDYLFGTNGILKNNIDSDRCLFVYVNKSAFEYLKDAGGNIINAKQDNQKSITENGKTYVWNGSNYVYTNKDTGIYWNSTRSWFNTDDNIESWESDEHSKEYNFAGTKPSYRFVFDIVAGKGQIAKTITIYYNGITYTISLAGMKIDSDEKTMTPQYIFTKTYYSSATDEWKTEYFTPSNNEDLLKIEPLLLEMRLYPINLNGSTLLAQIDFAMVSAGTHISVDFVDYSMVVASGREFAKIIKTHFGYELKDDKIINIVDSSNNAITTIEFDNTLNLYDGNKYTHTDGTVYYLKNTDGENPTVIVYSCKWDGSGYVYTNGSVKYYLKDGDGNKLGEQKAGETTIEYLSINMPTQNNNLFVSRNNNETNINPNSYSGSNIYFMVLGKNATTGAEVTSKFSENTVYTVSVNGANADNNNPSNTYNNTAEWGDFDDDTTSTQMTIKNASGANWIASFIIGTKTFDSTITSDIEFGYGEENNVLEETLKGNLPDDLKENALDNGELYEDGDGQVASGGTKFNANMSSNFAGLQDWYYTTTTQTSAQKVKYGATADLRGNKITYTIATQYGYEWEGATLVLKVGINSSKVGEFTSLAVAIGETTNTNYSVILSGSEEHYLLITLANLTSANSGDIVVSYGDKTMKIGSISWETGSLPTLTLTLARASINEINLDLHYNAKEFDVTYNTSSNFGTSPVGANGYADETVEDQARTFTYNLKQDLNKGWGETSLTYARIGYDQIGWAYDKFYKDEDGKTQNTTNNVLEPGNYKLQLYSITGGTGVADVRYADDLKDWYTSLGEGYADVFGTDKNGKITMHTIWNAKTYSLGLDYNDNTPEKGSTTGNGSTTSTKYTVSWVFDMPITSADIASDNVSFAKTGNTLTNQISRVYRLGYTFNGWYYKNGEFNGTTGWTHDETSYANGTAGYNGLVYLAHNDNVLTNNENSFKLALTNTSDIDLGYTSGKPANVFGYSVYQAINGAESWNEVAGETASSFNLYASWTANTYGFIYDLNGDDSISNNKDNGYKSLNYNGTISANTETGVGSSFATLAFGNTDGVVEVQFDENIGATLSAYAYRKGYRFTGWYFARTGENLAEETTLNQELLLKLLNAGTNELAQVKNKINTNYNAVNLIETLGTTGVTNGVSENKEVTNLSGNAILLHAQWEKLPYLVNIDLNNWKMSDYGKNDSEYIAGNSQYIVNNTETTSIQLEIYFDTQFKDLRLYDGTTWIEKTGGTTHITRNGKEYEISGDTAYDVLLQILTAYGYTLGNGTYDFTIYGNGDGTTSAVNIKNDTIFNINLYNQLIYFADIKDAGKIDNTNCSTSAMAKDELDQPILPTSGVTLETIDYSGQNTGDWHDYTDDEDMKNSAMVGYRQFTLFAIWTIKDIYLDNVYTKEQYNNALDDKNTSQTLFVKYGSGSGNKLSYKESTNSNNMSNTGYALANLGSEVDGYQNRYYSTNTYYLSPSTGQYFSSLTIWFNDNYLINSKYSNQTRGKLILTFEWNKVNRKLTITSATLEIGGMNVRNKFVAIYTATNTATEGLHPVISDDGQNVTISGEASYCFVGGIEISVSKYMLVTDVSEKNINTEYKNSEWVSRNVPTWLEDAGLKDVHYLTISITGQKSNLVFDGTTMGQTFDVDYYRFVRPSDGMQTYIDQTYIDNTTKSDTFGEEIWDSEFVNDWSMYEVYKTTTYRYGEYVSTAYSYATNFAFSSWYFYQGHIKNYEEYANYGGADIIYQTHESYLIPQTVQFVWNDGENKYVYTQTLTYYLKDVEGNVISTKQDEQDAITAKCLLAYATEEEDVTYVWNDAENKYVYTQTLTYYLKDAGEFVSKQDGKDSITGWLLVNSDGTYQCGQGQYALYDFLGTWSDPITYYWCTWPSENGSGERSGGYVTGNGLSASKDFDDTPGKEYEILDSGELFGYNDAGEKVKLNSITLHNYKYNEDYKDYRYDNNPVSGNVSMVAVYVPAQTRKVYYYTWKDSGSTSSGYEERTTTSNKYVLGVKYTASVKNVVETGGAIKSHGFIKYWELGTNNKYYRVGFSGFSSFDGLGRPTVTSALAFLMQFVNKDNWDNNKPTGIDVYAMDEYPTDVGGLVEISYGRIVRIINSLGYGTIGDSTTDVVTFAENLYRALLKQTTSYKAYEYLQNSEVALNLGLGDDVSKEIDACYKTLKNLARYPGITASDEDLLNISTFMGVYYGACNEGLSLTREAIQNLINGQDEDLIGWTDEIIDALSAEQLAVVLDKISMDYFGYVLINPSENIGYWPSGTYLAGWYMVPDTLRQVLINPTSAVLTFDSNNFISNGSLKCLEIVEEVEDPFGNITYIVQMPNGSVQYEVTRFNVFNKEQLDILSRVETSVYIFAAYNTIKFEIADLEYLKDELGKIVSAKYENGKFVESFKEKGVVYTWDGTGYAYYKVEYLTDDSGVIIKTQQQNESGKLLSSITKDDKTYVWNDGEKCYIRQANQGKVTGHLGIDIKYAHKTITKTDGNPYLYKNDDVRYVVLDSSQMLALAEEFKKNNNIPTSLQTVIGDTVSVYEELTDAIANAQDGETIVAFIYNLTSLSYIEQADGETVESKSFNNKEIIYFATTCCKKDGDDYYLYNLVENLNEIYDTQSAELYD